jgi:hypothetical protein
MNLAHTSQTLIPTAEYAPLVRVKIKKAYEFITGKGKGFACQAMQEVLHRYISDVIDR